MTKITEVLDRVARQTGVKAPSSWVTATRDDHVAIRDDFLRETVDDILDRLDLASPIGQQFTITGDGSETYDITTARAVDFRRLQRDQFSVYDVALDRPCIPITDDGKWTYIKDIGTTGIIRYYRLTGYEDNWSISFYDEPSAAVDITVSYISNYWKANSSGTRGDTFSDADDVLLLPRRLVEAGTVWRWRERQGLAYEDKYSEYEALMARLSNDSRARRVVNFGHKDQPRWQDLVPSFIPPS